MRQREEESSRAICCARPRGGFLKMHSRSRLTDFETSGDVVGELLLTAPSLGADNLGRERVCFSVTAQRR